MFRRCARILFFRTYFVVAISIATAIAITIAVWFSMTTSTAPSKLRRFLALAPLLVLLVMNGVAVPAQALLISHHYGPSPLSKWQEKVYRQRMSVCYQDIDIGLWGDACKASSIDKENCAMKCLSSACYESIYGADPLEEGELDMRRGREFRFCVRKAERAEKAGQNLST